MIEINVKLSKNVQSLFQRLEKRMADMSPVMGDIADIMYNSVMDNFLAGGRPTWAPLASVTKTIRKKEGKWPGQILQRSGRLKSSITSGFGSDFAIVGTNVKYAPLHQFGAEKGEYGEKTITEQVRSHFKILRAGKKIKVRAHKRTRKMQIPWGDVPARPFLALGDDDMRKIEDTLLQWLGE